MIDSPAFSIDVEFRILQRS